MSIDGVDVSLVSEMGSGEWASAMSLLDLAEAVVDGVGPEAAGDVLAACPQLLDDMPPDFFTRLADRHAALRRQEELEGVLLRQATAAVWAARQGCLGGNSTQGKSGHSVNSAKTVNSVNLASSYSSVKSDRFVNSVSRGGGDRSSPLGPRLAWLACEELTSFFQQRDDDVQGRESRRSTAAAAQDHWTLGALSQHPARRCLFGEGARYAGG
ncbi:unnamed protein product, partial [Laminaria digitata]